MPYITKLRRYQLLSGEVAQTAGELNFEITSLIKEYWQHGPQNYQVINDIIGALEGSKAEFQRRVVADYENKKIKENGDVY